MSSVWIEVVSAMNEVTELRIDGMSIGLLGVEDAFRAVRAEGIIEDAERAERLLSFIGERNYVPPGSRESYAVALIREYRRFLGEVVPEEEGCHALEVRVLGPGCPRCDMLMERTRAVLTELSLPAELRHITDIEAITDLGVIATPALVIDGEVRSVGNVPSADRIAAWLEQAARDRGEGE